MLQQVSCNPLLSQIENLAKEMAMNYFYSHSNEGIKVSLEDLTFLYRVLATPQEFLVQSM